MFNPVIGRFLAEDPDGYKHGETNLYKYCLNDPINFTDPSGRWLFLPEIGQAVLSLYLTETRGFGSFVDENGVGNLTYVFLPQRYGGGSVIIMRDKTKNREYLAVLEADLQRKGISREDSWDYLLHRALQNEGGNERTHGVYLTYESTGSVGRGWRSVANRVRIHGQFDDLMDWLLRIEGAGMRSNAELAEVLRKYAEWRDEQDRASEEKQRIDALKAELRTSERKRQELLELVGCRNEAYSELIRPTGREMEIRVELLRKAAEEALQSLRDKSFSLNLNRIPTEVVRSLVETHDAIQYDDGYVYLADYYGPYVQVLVLEPWLSGKRPRTTASGVSFEKLDESGLEHCKLKFEPSYYVARKRLLVPISGNPAQLLTRFQSKEVADRNVEATRNSRRVEHDVSEYAAKEAFLRFLPGVGGLDDIRQGKYLDGTLSLIGDAAFLTGIGGVIKGGEKGAKVLKFSLLAETAVATGRAGQGVYALSTGKKEDAYGYFGEATLRLFGVSLGTIQLLRLYKALRAIPNPRIVNPWDIGVDYLKGARGQSRIVDEAADTIRSVTVEEANTLRRLADIAANRGGATLESAIPNFNRLPQAVQLFLATPRTAQTHAYFGTALQQMCERNLRASGTAARYGLQFRTSAIGGVPDVTIVLPNGHRAILDWTTRRQCGEIYKYDSRDIDYLVEIIHAGPWQFMHRRCLICISAIYGSSGLGS